mgnify:CR=1 FL=1
MGASGAKADLDVGDRAAFDIINWNNDGRLDLVVGGLDGNVRLLLNQGTAAAPDFAAVTLVQADGDEAKRLSAKIERGPGGQPALK